MFELNSFQKKCNEKLIKELDSIGIEVYDFKIKETEEKWFAKKEVFIETSVNSLKLWIYEDGAHIQNKNDNMPFESPDYKTEDDLIKAFVEKVIVLLKNKKGDSSNSQK